MGCTAKEGASLYPPALRSPNVLDVRTEGRTRGYSECRRERGFEVVRKSGRGGYYTQRKSGKDQRAQMMVMTNKKQKRREKFRVIITCAIPEVLLVASGLFFPVEVRVVRLLVLDAPQNLLRIGGVARCAICVG